MTECSVGWYDLVAYCMGKHWYYLMADGCNYYWDIELRFLGGGGKMTHNFGEIELELTLA